MFELSAWKNEIFFLTLIFVVPTLAILGRSSWFVLQATFFFLIFSSAFPDGFSINFMSREDYRAVTRGFEVHLLDLLALALLITLFLRPKNFKIRWLPPLTILYLLYIFVGFISYLFVDSILYNPNELLGRAGTKTTPFETSLYPLFELFKMFRGLFFYWVCFNLLAEERMWKSAHRALLALGIYCGIFSLRARYLLGIHRVSLLLHPNIFNTFFGMVGAYLFPFIFSEKKLRSSLITAIAVGGCFIGIVLSISRSSLFGFLLVCALFAPFCLYLNRKNKNILFLLSGVLVCVIALFRAWDTLMERFLAVMAGEAVYDIRDTLILIAKDMGWDRILGVGLGNFSAYSISLYAEPYIQQEGAVWGGAVVHNLWYLTIAELGFIGLFVFLLFWARYYQMLFTLVLQRSLMKNPWFSSTVFGMIGSLIIFNIQELYHYSYRTVPIFFIMHLFMAMTACLYVNRKTIPLDIDLR